MDKYEKILDIVINIGRMVLECGGEIHRGEDTMERLLKHYGAEKYEVFTISSQITISALFEGKYYTLIKRVTKYQNDYDLLDRINNQSRYVCSNEVSIEELEKIYDELSKEHIVFTYYRLIGYLLSAASFTLFFGGDLLDALISLVLASGIFWSDKFIKKKLNGLVYAVLLCFVIGVLGNLFNIIGVCHNLDKILIGDVMLVIPGIIMTNSFRDLFLGDTISGAVRLIEAILTALCIALGFILSLYIFQHNIVASSIEVSWLTQVITGVVGSYGFAIMFNMNKKKMIYTGIGVLVSYFMYFTFMEVFKTHEFVSIVIAAAFGGLFGEIMARITKAPALCYIVISCVPLYPGAALYYTLTYLVSGNYEMALAKFLTLLSFIFGIAAGIILSSLLFKYGFKAYKYCKRNAK